MLLGTTLYINAFNDGSSGAYVISERNFELISANSTLVLTYSVHLTLKHVKQNWKSVFLKFRLISEIDTINVLEQIQLHNVNTVFIDLSLLGNVAEQIKNTFPNVYLIGFFHNVEYDYFKELIKVSKRFRHYFTLLLVKRAEFQLIKYADLIIALNKRDSKSLSNLYKKPADLILPTSIRDNYNAKESFSKVKNLETLNLLFVGSYFPPNKFAVDWFIRNVLVNIRRNVRFHVVGNGFETHELKEMDNRVNLVGRVSDLSEYYYLADIVVAPIFHGSGMKTKVAEALMYNKPVIGTKEAFEGYEVDRDKIGWQCDTAEEFINLINNWQIDYSLNVRKVFLNNYSSDTVKAKFLNFLHERKR